MSRRNVVPSRKFSEMPQEMVRDYENRPRESARVILELIWPAKQLRDAGSEKTTSGSPKTMAVAFLVGTKIEYVPS